LPGQKFVCFWLFCFMSNILPKMPQFCRNGASENP
jgi:hypothetical protein